MPDTTADRDAKFKEGVKKLTAEYFRECRIDMQQDIEDDLIPDYMLGVLLERIHNLARKMATDDIPEARELTEPLAQLDPTKWQ